MNVNSIPAQSCKSILKSWQPWYAARLLAMTNVLLFSHGRIPPAIPWDTTRRSQHNRYARRPMYVLLPQDQTGPQQSAKLKAPLQEGGSSHLLLKWTKNLQVSGRWISLQEKFLRKREKLKIPGFCTLRIKRDYPVYIIWSFRLPVSSCRNAGISPVIKRTGYFTPTSQSHSTLAEMQRANDETGLPGRGLCRAGAYWRQGLVRTARQSHALAQGAKWSLMTRKNSVLWF